MGSERTYGGYTLDVVEGFMAHARTGYGAALKDAIARIRELEAELANMNAELLRVRTTGHGAAHQLDILRQTHDLGPVGTSELAIREAVDAKIARVTAERDAKWDKEDGSPHPLSVENHSLCGHIAQLEAERDARWPAVEIPKGASLLLTHNVGDVYIAEFFSDATDCFGDGMETGPTPAAALEALRKKMEERK